MATGGARKEAASPSVATGLRDHIVPPNFEFFHLFCFIFFDLQPRHSGMASKIRWSRRVFLRKKPTNITASMMNGINS